jgi:hypothetical protein
MKKFLIIGSIVAVIMILVGGTGYAFARTQDLTNVQVSASNFVGRNAQSEKQGEYQGYGPGGMMGGYGQGYGPGGMMGGNGQGYGPGMMGGNGRGYGRGYGPGMMGGEGVGFMHDYMVSAFADAVGLTQQQVEELLANGETMVEIATAQGISQDALPALITQVRTAALDQAVAAGVITRAQADLMLEHMNEYMGPGFGPGFGAGDCPMGDWQEAQP